MSLRDDMTKHRIFVQRLAGTELENITSYLDQLKNRARLEITIGSFGDTLKTNLRNSIKDLSKSALENMTDIATYESQFSAKTFSKYFDDTVKPVDSETLKKAINNTNIAVNNVKIKSGDLIVDEKAKNKSLITAYNQFGQRKADEITQIIKDGQLVGMTKAETIAAVEERIGGLQTSQARVLATTAVNYTTNIAKSQTISENRDLIKQEVWVSQLEEGTCDYCSDEDGTIYDEGDAPDCPAHWNCMCEVIPYVE